MSKWTHPMCEGCWKIYQRDRRPVRFSTPEKEICCFCARDTTSGIYTREDPRSDKLAGICDHDRD